jgi:hypothetical protein
VSTEASKVTGVFRTASTQLTAGSGEDVWARWDEVRHASALLAAGLAAFRHGKSGSADVKPSWLQTILKGAAMVSARWLAFRAKGHDQEIKDTNSRA